MKCLRLDLVRFFNLSAAEEDLISGIPEAQVFTYAFWTVVLMSIVYWIPFEDLTVYASEYVFGITCLAIAAVGYRQCFYANGGNKGKDFLSRMACLGWVVGWRTFVPFVIVALVGWIAFAVYAGDQDFDVLLESQEMLFFDGVLFTFAEIMYWSFLKKSMHDVRRRIEAQS